MEIIKQWLKANGYKFEVESFGIAFKHQGGNFLIEDNSDDKQYLQIIMPYVHQLEKSSEKEKALEVCNEVNRKYKCLKAYLVEEDSIWLSVEMFMDQTPDLDDFMERLLHILHAGRLEILAKL